MSLQVDDDAFLKGLMVSMGATDFDESTVECLRQVATEQFLDVIGTARRLASHSGATAVGPDAAAAACELHMMAAAPQRERLMDTARLLNGRNVAWPLTADVLVPVDAIPPATLASALKHQSDIAAAGEVAPVGAQRRQDLDGRPKQKELAVRLRTEEERGADQQPQASSSSSAAGSNMAMAVDGGWNGPR